MTRKENIRAILECYFTGFKDVMIDSACERICELEQEPTAEKSVQDMTELEKALLHIKTRADAWAVKVIKDALSQEPCDKCVYSTKDGYCQYDDISETIPPLEPCTDAVSRDAILEWCGDINMDVYTDEVKEFVNGLPSVTQKPIKCDDAISRDAVKELIKSGVSTDTYDDVEQVCKWIDALPSVTHKSETVTEFADRCRECGAKYGKYRKEAKRWKNKWLKSQKSGKWIPHSSGIWIEYYECSECGRGHNTHSDYCPNCGAKMVEPQESEEQTE